MTILAVDDTDSRTRGMCTTYLGALLAERLDAERTLLVRLAPGVERKTRGNAAVAIHTSATPGRARETAQQLVEEYAATADPKTSPGVAVTGHTPGEVPRETATFTREAVHRVVSMDRALSVAAETDCWTVGWSDTERVETTPDDSPAQPTNDRPEQMEDGSSGRAGDDPPEQAGEDTIEQSEADRIGYGRIGAVAAIGAWRAFDDWTYERLVYRPRERWGTERAVETEGVFTAAASAYPTVWDTVDRVEREPVCVPHTPGPVLFGIRGDEPGAVERVAAAIDREPAERAATFVTNQGTDAHLRAGTIDTVREGRAYRIPGVVVEPPTTREGGHVFLTIAPSDAVSSDAGGTSDASGADATRSAADAGEVPAPSVTDETPRLDCAAFEPTKRFRERVRGLRAGDRVTVCGEVSDGTCKLEKFAVRGLVRQEPVNPTCPDCGRSMSSAGRGQGYRCRDCRTHADGPAWESVERELERGWYEVPPCARRHVAKPLVRGGFDAPTHPER